MEIQEAIKLANLKFKAITRKSWVTNGIIIFPTDTEYKFILFRLKQKEPGCRWQPGVEDILADDWIVTK